MQKNEKKILSALVANVADRRKALDLAIQSECNRETQQHCLTYWSCALDALAVAMDVLGLAKPDPKAFNGFDTVETYRAAQLLVA